MKTYFVVLILVLVEIGLGALILGVVKVKTVEVLILVLVEIGLGVRILRELIANSGVLILVLVEIGLGDFGFKCDSVEAGLNPCFSGNRFGS